MSKVVNEAVAALNEKLSAGDFDSTIKIEIDGEGALIIDEDGARASDDDADCTMSADADTLKGMLDGSVNPTAAFMGGQLKVEGDMGVAMKLGALLA